VEVTAIEITPVVPIRVIESRLVNAFRVEVTPPGAHRPLVFRVVLSSRTFDWMVRDPYGATLCRAETSERGIEIARMMAGRLLDLSVNTEELSA
jgi:hypothetical protein